MSMSDAEKTKKLRKDVAPFAKSETKISIIQIMNTIIPLLIIWGIGYGFANTNPWIGAFCGLLASGFVVRTFIIFHDCTHGSFFKSKKANDLVGNITGILTSFPYAKWRREHLIHHATSGNLDKRGIGDIDMLTVDEYLALSKMKRLAYRLYRNPFVMFGLGPLYLVLVLNRFNRKGAPKRERYNTYLINISIVAIYALFIWGIGWQTFLAVQFPIMYLAAAVGIWLFYIQHTFEDSYFENEDEWDYVKAAVEGSSYYKLPKVLEWITGNIGYHHVHHLAPKIPNYYLEEAHESTPPLQKATTITIPESFKSIRFRLYDPDNKKFVSFKEFKSMERERQEKTQLGRVQVSLPKK